MWVTFSEGVSFFLQRVTFFCNRCHFFLQRVSFFLHRCYFFAHQYKEQKTLQRTERDSPIDESDKESNSDVIFPDLNNSYLKSSKLRKCRRFFLYGFADSEENKSSNYRWVTYNSSNPMNACEEFAQTIISWY